MHINSQISDFHDVITKEQVNCFDVINDSKGTYFGFFNTPNASNGGTDIYNVEDGWLDAYMPENYPFEEGTTVEMNWKFQIRGDRWGMSTLIQLHRNAKGEVTADVEKSEVICSE
jgi:hypothetical protein